MHKSTHHYAKPTFLGKDSQITVEIFSRRLKHRQLPNSKRIVQEPTMMADLTNEISPHSYSKIHGEQLLEALQIRD